MTLRRRPAARLLVTDARHRILLFRSDHKAGALAGTSYWATPGGGVEPGESFEQAAMREMREETGVLIEDPGPVISSREVVLRLSSGEYVLEEERYFHVPVIAEQIKVDQWNPDELEFMTEFRWWSASDLSRTHETISPDDLLVLLKRVTA